MLLFHLSVGKVIWGLHVCVMYNAILKLIGTSIMNESINTLITLSVIFFFLNDTAPPEISPLPLPAALPISQLPLQPIDNAASTAFNIPNNDMGARHVPVYECPSDPRGSTFNAPGAGSYRPATLTRSEEHTSELQSQSNLVCRLLLEKKTMSP